MTTRTNVDENRTHQPIIAIHQPNFAPWAGFFHKMLTSNRFVYLDTAPFTRNSYQNRSKILTSDGAQWLTVPVLTKGKSGDATNTIKINNQTDWQRKHLKSIRLNYSKAPFFDLVYPRIESVYSEKETFLAQFNIKMLECLRLLLDIKTPVFLASELNEKGTATHRLISLVQSINGKIYLSGSGGKKYLDEAMFKLNKIELRYQDFTTTNYPQNSASFISGLSILDALFSLGFNTIKWLNGGLNE